MCAGIRRRGALWVCGSLRREADGEPVSEREGGGAEESQGRAPATAA